MSLAEHRPGGASPGSARAPSTPRPVPDPVEVVYRAIVRVGRAVTAGELMFHERRLLPLKAAGRDAALAELVASGRVASEVREVETVGPVRYRRSYRFFGLPEHFRGGPSDGR